MASRLPPRVCSGDELNLGRGLGDFVGNLGAILVSNLRTDDVWVTIAIFTGINLTPRVVANFNRMLLSQQLGNFALPI
jgi:hypothetical protein